MSHYGPIANQRIRSTTDVKISNGDKKKLEAGSFIKYVRKEYMPKDHPFGDYNEDLYIAALTKVGMALVDITEVDWDVY